MNVDSLIKRLEDQRDGKFAGPPPSRQEKQELTAIIIGLKMYRAHEDIIDNEYERLKAKRKEEQELMIEKAKEQV